MTPNGHSGSLNSHSGLDPESPATGQYAICRSEFESPEVDGEILLRNPSPDLRVGDMVRVRIVAAEDYDLIAEPLPRG